MSKGSQEERGAQKTVCVLAQLSFKLNGRTGRHSLDGHVYAPGNYFEVSNPGAQGYLSLQVFFIVFVPHRIKHPYKNRGRDIVAI